MLQRLLIDEPDVPEVRHQHAALHLGDQLIQRRVAAFQNQVAAPAAESTRTQARDLLKASILYLPLLLAAMILNAHGRVWF